MAAKPVPDDFAVYGPIEGDLRLRKRYSVGGVRIAEWRKESGIYCGGPRGERKPKAPKVQTQQARRGRKPSPLTWYDDDPDEIFDPFFELGLSGRRMIEW